MSQSNIEARKRSGVRRIDKSPRFTTVDFFIPPAGANIDIPVKGRAVQLISVYDANAETVPAISGTDNEVVPAFDVPQDTNVAGLGQWIFAGAQALNAPTGNLASIAGPSTFRVTLAAALPAGTITINPQAVNITGIPSGAAGVMTTNLISIPFPGGGPGVVNVLVAGAITVGMPVAPAIPNDATFNVPVPPPATTGYVITYANGIVEHFPAYNIPSTWGQPATAGVIVSRTGYVHLNVVSNHIPAPTIGVPGQVDFLQEQCIPIPAAPAVIRVEQEFDWVSIRTAAGVADAFPCVGILIIEHETEQEVVP